MKIKHFYSLVTSLVTAGAFYAQVGINTQTPQATLDVVGNATDITFKDGIIPPRISKQDLASKNLGTYDTTQEGAIVYVNNITAPTGNTPSLTQVANITSKGFYYFTGSVWQPYTSSGTSTSTSGFYDTNGSLTDNRVVTQGANTLAFVGTAVNSFSVDGSTFSVDATNHRVGVGTAAPTNAVHVNATNPLRLEGLQSSSGSAGTLSVNSTGVVQLRNSSSISAVRGTGTVSITVNNNFVNATASTKTFDNLNEMSGNTFTAASTGLYKVDFVINYPQRSASEDDGDGYLGYSQIRLNGIQQSFTNTKVTLPESSAAPSFVTCTNSVLLKMNAGQVLSFQALVFGATPNSTSILAPFTINVVRID